MKITYVTSGLPAFVYPSQDVLLYLLLFNFRCMFVGRDGLQTECEGREIAQSRTDVVGSEGEGDVTVVSAKPCGTH